MYEFGAQSEAPGPAGDSRDLVSNFLKVHLPSFRARLRCTKRNSACGKAKLRQRNKQATNGVYEISHRTGRTERSNRETIKPEDAMAGTAYQLHELVITNSPFKSSKVYFFSVNYGAFFRIC